MTDYVMLREENVRKTLVYPSAVASFDLLRLVFICLCWTAFQGLKKQLLVGVCCVINKKLDISGWQCFCIDVMFSMELMGLMESLMETPFCWHSK